MNGNKVERPVSLSESSWQLLDGAASLWGGSQDEVLDSVIQGFLKSDGGTAVSRAEALHKLKQVFGQNRG